MNITFDSTVGGQHRPAIETLCSTFAQLFEPVPALHIKASAGGRPGVYVLHVSNFCQSLDLVALQRTLFDPTLGTPAFRNVTGANLYMPDCSIDLRVDMLSCLSKNNKRPPRRLNKSNPRSIQTDYVLQGHQISNLEAVLSLADQQSIKNMLATIIDIDQRSMAGINATVHVQPTWYLITLGGQWGIRMAKMVKVLTTPDDDNMDTSFGQVIDIRLDVKAKVVCIQMKTHHNT